jgi:hypothetical protein
MFEHGPLVSRLVTIEQGEKMKAIRKNGFHAFFGWPLM